MRRWMAGLGAAALSLSLSSLVGCGGGNSLSGSLEELFSLEVSTVSVLRNAQALQVNYYRNNGRDVDLVASLTFSLEGIELRRGKGMSLAGEASPGHPRATLVRRAAGEPTRVFAPVDKGDITLEKGGEVGQTTQGDFSLSLEQGDGYGAGRTLEGDFSAMTADAGFGFETGDIIPPEAP